LRLHRLFSGILAASLCLPGHHAEEVRITGLLKQWDPPKQPNSSVGISVIRGDLKSNGLLADDGAVAQTVDQTIRMITPARRDLD
jgi:hypothetical protein